MNSTRRLSCPSQLGFHRTTFFTRSMELKQARAQFVDGLEKFAQGDAVRYLATANTPTEFKEMLGNFLAELEVQTPRLILARYASAVDYPHLQLKGGAKNNMFFAPTDKNPGEFKFGVLTVIMLGQEKDPPFYALNAEGKDPNCLVNLLKPLFTDALAAAVKKWEAVSGGENK